MALPTRRRPPPWAHGDILVNEETRIGRDERGRIEGDR